MARTQSREPAATGTVITASVPVLLLALVSLGVIDLDSDQQSAVAAALAALATIISGFLGWWHTRGKVTPLSSPRDNRNVDLVPADRSGQNFI